MGLLLVSISAVLLAASVAQGQQTDQPGAIWMPSPHKSNGRQGQQVKWLILHGTAGGSSAQGVGRWFQDPRSQASTHYIVGQDGAIVQSVRERDMAWGNGKIESGADKWWGPTNPNLVTISIEHVKTSTSNSNQLTPAQKDAGFKLVRDIIRRNPGIKPRRADASGGITGHFSISPQSRKNCPGPYPWDELFRFLGGNSGPTPAPGSRCTATVTANDGLRIRAQPNTRSEVKGSVGYNQNVVVTSRVVGENVNGNTHWFAYNGGYLSGAYLRLQAGGPAWCQ